MIRKLCTTDNDVVMPFLAKEPAKNLFIIGDIYNNGYECEYQECWGDFDADGKLRAVLLRYYDHYIIAADENHDTAGFSAICRQDGKFVNIAGSADSVAIYQQLLDLAQPRRFFFAQQNELTDFGTSDIVVECTVPGDACVIAALLADIKEFPNPAGAERIKHSIETGEGRYFVVRKNNAIIANAATTAENPYSAMIIAVACAAEYRGKGYATACMRKLCATLHAEGKVPCLFYDNPAAGSIYHKLGFRNIGDWMLIGKKPLNS
ncbi:MAG: GNAT family N-acetyltransferase [Bacillota bacterium]